MRTKDLTHLNSAGRVHMIDVSEKTDTERRASAEGRLFASPEVLHTVLTGTAVKGDVLAVTRIAAIMAAKRTAEWIPLCHPISLSGIDVAIELEADAIRVVTEVATTAATGVEMEALTGVNAALLTLYDMLKSVDRGMHLGGIRLLSKSGGRSGSYRAPRDGLRGDG